MAEAMTSTFRLLVDMEAFVEFQGLTTLLSFCPTRMHEDVTRDTFNKDLKSASPQQGGAPWGRTGSQSRSDSSQGNVDSGSAPPAVTRTCCSSLTPSVSPTAPI